MKTQNPTHHFTGFQFSDICPALKPNLAFSNDLYRVLAKSIYDAMTMRYEVVPFNYNFSESESRQLFECAYVP